MHFKIAPSKNTFQNSKIAHSKMSFKLLPQKIYFKTLKLLIQKIHLKIAPSKNTFQNIGTHGNCSLKNAFQNWSLKKYITKHRCTLKLLPQKMHSKTFITNLFYNRVYVQ